MQHLHGFVIGAAIAVFAAGCGDGGGSSDLATCTEYAEKSCECNAASTSDECISGLADACENEYSSERRECHLACDVDLDCEEWGDCDLAC